jgi:hypothetical protein
MSKDLQDLLHRVADQAPAVHIDDDTWQRARRARRRERIVLPAVAATLVLGALVLGAQPWRAATRGTADPATGGTGRGAVPSHISAVPERLERRDADGAWSPPREPATVVRRASVGYVSRSGGAVLVSATDGVHHRVSLPGFNDRFVGMDGEGPVLALSPDGDRVAYAWRQRVPRPGERVPSGLAVLDLASGSVATYRLPGGLGVRVNGLGWSPAGTWLVYRAGVLDRVAADSFSTSGYRLERLDLRTGGRSVAPRRMGRVSGPTAISDDGTVALAAGGTLLTWPAGPGSRFLERRVGSDLSGPSAWSPDGRRVAVGAATPVRSLTLVPAKGRAEQVRAGTVPRTMQVLGFAGRGHVVVVRHGFPSWSEAALVLIPTDGGRERRVGTVDAGIGLDSLTIATGLMAPAHPTANFGDPGWPADPTRWWVAGGLLTVVLAAGAVAGAVRRRRPRGFRPGSPR